MRGPGWSDPYLVTAGFALAGRACREGRVPGRYAVLAAALAVVVGLLCVLAFVARLGFVADLLSKPILVGYMAGVAVIMIIGQLGKITGVPVRGETLPAQVASFVGQMPDLR